MSDAGTPPHAARPADLLVRGARLVATVDDDRRELAGGWVAITDGAVSGVGPPGSEPEAVDLLDATDCLVTPGLVNTHHHLYQNLTRALPPATGQKLFDWLTTLYPIWALLDEEAAHVSAWVGMAELALGGCTTTSDHLYVHPDGGGDLIAAEVAAAVDLGVRFHATRGSMSLSRKDGGLPPDSVVQEPDEILADSERLVGRFHDVDPLAMVRVALAPCSPFSVTQQLMVDTAELAERLDVRLHTHIAEDLDEDDFCLERFGCRPIEYLEQVGWGSDRTWVAHCVQPNEAEVERLGAWGTGVAHCPSSNMVLGVGIAPVTGFLAAGVPVGLGCDGSASADSASLWTEARNAMLLAKLRGGADAFDARRALELATRGGADCLGRRGEIGQLSVGAAGDLVVWGLDGPAHAGALADPVEALLRCGPNAARHTVVAGRVVVRDGRLTHPGLDEQLAAHRAVATRWQSTLLG
ncbi:8-oxoguanine deaminase [Dermatobacter hominis]|uniref:8-oxoguanine deaminase n=1 Tax=Dermatobacter hominis TaxID=2884263 RepID=UPI001D113138|nr:8-oxoguanine deaminase [Dermatobacter hominis]UDY35465.1 8-oxoguanine deaminase [Dermatobacter hominis]